MANSFLVFYVTHPDEATAQRIADILLQARLVACANIFPITSAYWWEGVIAKEGEWVSILKTPLSLEVAVEAAILKVHPYEVPCVLRFEVKANEAYAVWIEESTGSGVKSPAQPHLTTVTRNAVPATIPKRSG